jgi:hypothetical protein
MTAHGQRKVLAAREPQKFEMTLNLDIAKALGTMIRSGFLVQAGEVMQ